MNNNKNAHQHLLHFSEIANQRSLTSMVASLWMKNKSPSFILLYMMLNRSATPWSKISGLDVTTWPILAGARQMIQCRVQTKASREFRALLKSTEVSSTLGSPKFVLITLCSPFSSKAVCLWEKDLSSLCSIGRDWWKICWVLKKGAQNGAGWLSLGCWTQMTHILWLPKQMRWNAHCLTESRLVAE